MPEIRHTELKSQISACKNCCAYLARFILEVSGLPGEKVKELDLLNILTAPTLKTSSASSVDHSPFP